MTTEKGRSCYRKTTGQITGTSPVIPVRLSAFIAKYEVKIYIPVSEGMAGPPNTCTSWSLDRMPEPPVDHSQTSMGCDSGGVLQQFQPSLANVRIDVRRRDKKSV